MKLALPVILFCLSAGAAAFFGLPENPRRASATDTPARAYLGFDRNNYPGDDALAELRKTFAFTSYWLGPPPGEKTNSWLGKREVIRSHGFGFALLFAGPTSRELLDAPFTLKKATEDVETAAAAARREGFPPGSVIFLDIEEGGRLPSTYFQYLQIWTSELSRSGFAAGVYCSSIPIDEGEGVIVVTSDFIRSELGTTNLVYWVYNDMCPPSNGCAFPKNPPPPSKSGAAYAAIWQFAQSPRRKEFAKHCPPGYARDNNCYAPIGTAHRWHLDVNTATSADPSGAAK